MRSFILAMSLVCLVTYFGVFERQALAKTEPIPATITIDIQTDMAEWVENPDKLVWGIAISTENITEIIRDDQTYNEPALDLSKYSDYIIKSDMVSFEKYEIKVSPGKYDWLILMDHNSDGTWDSYLGTTQEEIQLNEFQFLSGYKYSAVIGRDSVTNLTVTVNK